MKTPLRFWRLPWLSGFFLWVPLQSAEADAPAGLRPAVELLPGARLTWQAEAGLRYRIEKSTTLTASGPGGWQQVALVEADGAVGEWLDPEPPGEKAFYRVAVPEPEVFSFSQPVLSQSGGDLLIQGQQLPGGVVLVLEIDGASSMTVPLEDLGDGVWRARVEGGFTPGSLVTAAVIQNASGETVLALNQPLEVTESGRASDGPPALPPGAPIVNAHAINTKGAGANVGRVVSGSPIYQPSPSSGENPLFQSSLLPAVNAHAIKTKGTGAEANRASVQDHNSSRSNKTSSIIAPAGSGLPGEVAFHMADLALDCPAGPPLAWISTYRSKGSVSSGHGPGWDFCYNVSIEPLPAAAGPDAPRLRLCDGGGRACILYRKPDGSYSADGLFREGRFSGNGVFTLTFADTGKWVFRALDSSPAAGKLAAITDRNDVSLTLAYDAASGQLSSVDDTFGHRLSVAWINDRIASVIAEKGGAPLLRVSYTYSGADGMKTAVSCPFVPGSPPVAGDMTFAYAAGSPDPRLNDNLLSITDGAGRLYEAFTYTAAADPRAVDYDAVATHDRHGGGHVTILKMSMAEVMVAGNLACYAIYENDELGRVTETLHDSQHRPIRIREYTGFATPGEPVTADTLPNPATKLRASDPAFFETTIAYNADSCPIAITHPDGSREECLYDRDLRRDCPVRERGNARVLTLVASNGATRSAYCYCLPGFGSEPSAKPGNPIGGLTIKGGRNPGGGMEGQHYAAPGNPIGGISVKGGKNPSKRATGTGRTTGYIADITLKSDPPSGRPTGKRIFEPMGSINGGGMPNRISMNVTVPKQTQGQTFGERVVSPRDAASGLPTGKRQHKPLALSPPRDAASGLPTGKRQHKPLRAFDPGFDAGSSGDEGMTTRDAASGLPTGRRQHTPIPPGFPTQIITAHGQKFAFDYDGHGNLTGETGPLPGSGAQYEYNARGQLTACTVLNGEGSSFYRTYNYLEAWPVSMTDDPGGLALTTAFAYDDLGRCVSVTDPLGHDWLFGYNPLGQCITASSPEIAPGVRITTTAIIDAGGCVVRCDTDHLGPDGTPVASNPAYSDFCVYGSRGSLVRVASEERPVNASGVLVPDTLGLENFAVCDITYDAAGQIVRLSTPASSRGQAEDLVCDFTFDERGMPHRCIEGGAGTPGAVTTECDYDALGAPVRYATVVAQGVPAPVTLLAYDGFHRLSSVTDAMGNVASFEYGNQGRVITSIHGELDDQPGSTNNALLYKSTGSGLGTGKVNMQDLHFTAMAAGSGLGTGKVSMQDLHFAAMVSGGGLGTGKVSMQDFHFTMRAQNNNTVRSNRSNFALSDLFFDVFTPDDTLIEERFTPGAPGAPVTETTVIHHSPAGLPVSVTCNGDSLLSIEYDRVGRPIRCDDGACAVTVTRDGNGNTLSCGTTPHLLHAGQPEQTFTYSFVYDALGRCVQATDGAGNTASVTYDSLSRPVTVTEPGGLVVQLEYDGVTSLGDAFSSRVLADADNNGTPEVLSSALARCGELLHVEDSAARRTTFTCDALGRVTRVTCPDATFEEISYDSSGRPTGMRQRNGALITYGHDALHRVISISHADLPSSVQAVPATVCVYDGRGLARSVTQGDSTVSFTCDSLGNALTETTIGSDQFSHTVTSSFDHRGRTSVTYPNGSSFAETRDALGRLLTVSAVGSDGQPVSPLLASHEYAGSRLWRSTTGNGVVTTYSYRGDGDSPMLSGDLSFDACVRVLVQNAANSILEDTRCRRDADQQLLQKVAAFAAGQQGQQPPRHAITLTRNLLGHVTGALTQHREFPGGPDNTSEVSYTLDLEGRRLSVSGGASPGAYHQDALGRYEIWPGGPLEWDAEDNLSLFTRGTAGQLAFAYDAENRLVSVTNPGGGSVLVSYTYDALGRRVSRSAPDAVGGAVIRDFVYDGGSLILDLDRDGDDDLAISDFGLSRQVVTGDGSVQYLHHNVQHWGDPHENLNGKHIKDWEGKSRRATLVTDASGTPLERFAYDDACIPLFLDASGRTRPGASAPIGPIRWMAPEALWEPDLRLYLSPSSIYSPDLGQTTSKNVVKFKAGADLAGKKEFKGHVTLLK